MHTPVGQSHLLIAGVARNCEKSLERDIDVLASAAHGFASVRFLVIESDSTDGSLEVLARLTKQLPHFAFISMGALAPQHPMRTDRIAVCRNRYLDELRTNAQYADTHYVLIADLDDVNRDLTRAALESCWMSGEPWDVCTANQRDAYYDVWALRHPDWCPVDCWRQYHALRPRFGHEQALLMAIHSRMVRLHPRSPWIEVDSAFGGLALYRRDALLSSRYLGLDGDREICEHVSLHAGLHAQGYRIFINPQLINSNRTIHGDRKRWHVRLRRRVRSLGKALRARVTGKPPH